MSQGEGPIEPALEDAARWRFGEVVLDERTMELSLAGNKIDLARKPLELLMYFVRNPGEVVTKDELFEAVWPGRIVSETSLTNAISRLRSALGDDDSQALIKSVYGYGYRFMGEVSRETPRSGSLPAPLPAVDFRSRDPVPYRAGWSLSRRLGAGGGGDAWLGIETATQDTRVFKFARDRLALTALKREITLSRLMRESLGPRPDLVGVLDWSLDEAPYFIAIEHCSEGSLSDWAQTVGGVQTVPLAQRLELLAQAAEALAAAHSVGVLHKDIKPSNLLLHKSAAGRLQLKLSDFGSARLLDRDRLNVLNIARLGFTQTVAETSTGTPQYQAPELLEGSPSTIRSDVYALGVVLYQLVVGDLRRPLAPGWESKISDPLLIEDISAAAAGDPQARLTDAAQLAQRLRTLPQRHAASARAKTARQDAERIRLALDRARARRGLLQALAATLVIGLAATAYFLWQSTLARKQAQSEAARANAVTRFMTENLIGAANPILAGRRDVSMREVLDSASAQLDGAFKDQPRAHATLERVIGGAYAALRETGPAERLLLQAESELAAALGPAAAETQSTRAALRDMYLFSLDSDAATKVGERILATENAAGRPNLDLALEIETDDNIWKCWSTFLSPYLARCDAVADAGRKLTREKLGPESRSALFALLDAGDVRLKNGRAAEAIAPMREAHAGLVAHYPNSRFQIFVANSLMLAAMVDGGEAAQALQPLMQQAARFAEIYGPASRLALKARLIHARANQVLGNSQDALNEFAEIRAAFAAQDNARPDDWGWLASGVGETLLQLNRPVEAEAAFRDGLEKRPAAENTGNYWTWVLRDHLADARLAQNDRDGAEQLMRQNLEQEAALLTRGEWLLGWHRYRLGDLLWNKGQRDAAGPLLASGHAILLDALGQADARTRQAQAAVERATR